MCRRQEGCPKGTPEQSKALNESNQRCYEHYRECNAVGKFPSDPIVTRNAAVIAEVIDQAEKDERKAFEMQLIQLAMVGKAVS